MSHEPVGARQMTHLEAVACEPQRPERDRVAAANVRVVPALVRCQPSKTCAGTEKRDALDERADEEGIRPDEPPLEARLVLVDPLDGEARLRLDDGPLLRPDRERRKALGELERDAHEGARDEEADGDVEEVEEACASERETGLVSRVLLRKLEARSPCSGVDLSGPWKRSSSGKPRTQLQHARKVSIGATSWRRVGGTHAARSSTSALASFSVKSMMPAGYVMNSQIACFESLAEHRRRTRRVDGLEDPSKEDRQRDERAVEQVRAPLRVKLEVGPDVKDRGQHRVAVGEVDHHRLAVLPSREKVVSERGLVAREQEEGERRTMADIHRSAIKHPPHTLRLNSVWSASLCSLRSLPSLRCRPKSCAMRIASPSTFHVLLAAVPFSSSIEKA